MPTSAQFKPQFRPEFRAQRPPNLACMIYNTCGLGSRRKIESEVSAMIQQQGADPSGPPDARGCVALHHAAAYDMPTTIVLLATAKRYAPVGPTNMNPQTPTESCSAFAGGLTPLHVAVRRRHVRCAVALLRCGASLDARTCDGRTALSIAVENEDEAMIAVLERAKEFIPFRDWKLVNAK